MSHGVVGAAGIVAGIQICGHAPALLAAGAEFLRTSAIYLALAFLVIWFGRALIVAVCIGFRDAVNQAMWNKENTGAYHIFR